MEALQNFSDERILSGCIYCGGPSDTREHVPSRVLLDKPYPANLPVVAACRTCNSGFSLDEEYLACIVECALAGEASPEKVSRPKIVRILRQRPALLARVRAAMAGQAGMPEVETLRVRSVIVKLAAGHAAYELSSVHRSAAECEIAPFPAMTREQRLRFEHAPTGAHWPELGSRAMQRLAHRQAPAPTKWLPVQAGRYRYLAFAAESRTTVRIVLSEYLACEVVWHDDWS